MLKTKRISAVSLALPNGVEAVLVQQGPAWNGLHEYKCISPALFAGQTVITMPQANDRRSLGAFFAVLRRLDDEEVIVMASPDIGAEIQAANIAAAS